MVSITANCQQWARQVRQLGRGAREGSEVRRQASGHGAAAAYATTPRYTRHVPGAHLQAHATLTLTPTLITLSLTHLQAHAVVADLDELVDRLSALLVGREGELLPLALLVRGRGRGRVRGGATVRVGVGVGAS